MHNNVSVLSVVLIIFVQLAVKCRSHFKKLNYKKQKIRNYWPLSRSLFVKGINGPVGWVGNAFAKATAMCFEKRAACKFDMAE